MRETGDTLLYCVVSAIVFGAGLAIFFKIASEHKVRRSILAVLVLLILTGIIIFSLNFARFSEINNIGRPMSFKDLKENCEFRLEDFLGGLAVVSYEKENRTEIRSIYDFPRGLPKGIKFIKQKGVIVFEIQKLSI